MKEFNGLENYINTGCTVLVLGMFDGLHLGHLALFDKAFEIAGKDTVTVLTFANHFKSMENPFPLLMTKEEKTARLCELGVDQLILQTVDPTFMNTEPEKFIRLLKKTIDIKAIVVGFDYTFGRLGKGEVNMLKQNFEHVYVIDEVDIDGEKVSSTRLRTALNRCDFDDYIKLCKRPYAIMGSVIHGNKLGGKHDTPTINLPIPVDKLIPKDGVYMVKADINGHLYDAIANLGCAPTFNRDKRVLEVHIFDFDNNAYGNKAQILFYKRIRDIIKFNSPQELYSQIRVDICDTKSFFNTLK